MSTDLRAAGRIRVLLGVAGVALIGVGGVLVLTGGRSTNLLWVLVFGLGPLVVHDALLAPLVALLGWFAARHLAPALRAPLQVALVVGGSLLLVGLPLVIVQLTGRRPTDNPSVDPLDYSRNMIALLAVVVAAAAGTGARVAQRRRATNARPPSDQASSTS